MIRHIVWDWNGTLLDDTALTVQAAAVGLEAIGCSVDLRVERWREIATRPIHALYETLVGYPIDMEQWQVVEDTWMATYLNGLGSVGLNQTALEALDEARERGMTQSIVSLHLESELRDHVRTLGIEKYFTDIAGSKAAHMGVRPSKARVVVTQLAAVGVSPVEAAMIGDMADDAREAEEAGVGVVLVSTGDTSHARLMATGHLVETTLIGAVRSLRP